TASVKRKFPYRRTPRWASSSSSLKHSKLLWRVFDGSRSSNTLRKNFFKNPILSSVVGSNVHWGKRRWPCQEPHTIVGYFSFRFGERIPGLRAARCCPSFRVGPPPPEVGTERTRVSIATSCGDLQVFTGEDRH